MTEHRVELLQAGNAILNRLQGDSHGFRQLSLCSLIVRNKLVERRIKQTNGDRQALHRLENPVEVLPLYRQQLRQSFFAPLRIRGQDHFTYRLDPAFTEEHVLGTAQPDSFSAEVSGHFRVMRRVGVGANTEGPELISPIHKLAQIIGDLGLDQIDTAHNHFSRGTVESDPVALIDTLIAEHHIAFDFIDPGIAASGHTALTHTAGHHGSVRGHPATRGKDTFCYVHTTDILRRSLGAYQDDRFAVFRPGFSVSGRKDHLTNRRSRRSRQALGRHIYRDVRIDHGV